MAKLREWARQLKQQTLVLYFAVRDPRTPLPAKLVAGFVVAYAISPIDLIPDFIPVIGLLDDVILVPIGIWLALKFVPPIVMKDAAHRAEASSERPTSKTAGAVIIAIWGVCAASVGWWLYRVQ